MKSRVQKLTIFSRRIRRGIHIEWKETLEIPSLLKNKAYKKAALQVLDIGKMLGLTVIWLIPGGAVLTAVILKFSHKARPSAFNEEMDEKTCEEEASLKEEDPSDTPSHQAKQ